MMAYLLFYNRALNVIKGSIIGNASNGNIYKTNPLFQSISMCIKESIFVSCA